jgi:hypothetical protein
LLAALVPCAPLSAQSIEVYGLGPVQVAEARYDSQSERLAVVLSCESWSPLTAWSIQVAAGYRDGSRRFPGQLSDSAIEFAYPDGTDASPRNDEGVCYSGQSRSLSLAVQRKGHKGGALEAIAGRVDLVIDADRVGYGDIEKLSRVRESRERQAKSKAVQVNDLRTAMAQADLKAAVRKLIAAKRAAGANSTRIFDAQPGVITVSSDVGNLESIVWWSGTGRTDLRTAIEFLLKRTEMQSLTLLFHSQIRGVEWRPEQPWFVFRPGGVIAEER